MPDYGNTHTFSLSLSEQTGCPEHWSWGWGVGVLKGCPTMLHICVLGDLKPRKSACLIKAC